MSTNEQCVVCQGKGHLSYEESYRFGIHVGIAYGILKERKDKAVDFFQTLFDRLMKLPPTPAVDVYVEPRVASAEVLTRKQFTATFNRINDMHRYETGEAQINITLKLPIAEGTSDEELLRRMFLKNDSFKVTLTETEPA